MNALRPVLLVALFAVGCRASAIPSGSTGAATSTEAVVAFLGAAKSQDLQAIANVWGNEESPTRDRVERQELERRLLIITCHLRHDESRIGRSQLGEGGRTINDVELVKGNIRVSVPFTTVKNPRNSRWYVEDVDLRPARPICNAEPMTRPSAPPAR